MSENRKTGLPTLQFLASMAYNPNPSGELRLGKMRTVTPFSCRCGLVLERWRCAKPWVDHPPTYNPFKWRLIYSPPESPCHTDLTGDHCWNHIVWYDQSHPTRSQTIGMGTDAVVKLRMEFGDNDGSRVIPEGIWRDQESTSLRVAEGKNDGACHHLKKYSRGARWYPAPNPTSLERDLATLEKNYHRDIDQDLQITIMHSFQSSKRLRMEKGE